MKKIMAISLFLSILYCRELDVQFISEEQWLVGMPWLSGIAYDNSVAYGLGIYGTSSIDESNIVDIDIQLTEDESLQSNAMVFSSSSMQTQLGVGIFPGSAWDMSDPENPRRLNICFFENSSGDFIWNPDSPNGMDLEYLLIMMSDYDSTGQYYDNVDILESDVLYFCWFRGNNNFNWLKN